MGAVIRDPFWGQRRVFLTGATGLLGSWLAEALVLAGAEVTCLVRDGVKRSRFFDEGISDRCSVVRGSVEDYFAVLRAINEYEVDTVFHLAAQTIVGTAARSVFSTFESNIKGTWTVLEACRDCSELVERVVLASSDKAYGSQKRLPYTEETPLAGRHPYDVSKSCADLIALTYHETFGVPVAITRCGNLYGGGDLNWNRIVPGTIRAALEGQRPVIRSTGELARDYFYVEDAVGAYLTLGEHLVGLRLGGQAFNFGTGEPLTVLELTDAILEAVDRRDLEPRILGTAEHEIPAQYLDSGKARAVLGWKPRMTLQQGLERTVEWYRRSDWDSAHG